jgi:hypothetical protein
MPAKTYEMTVQEAIIKHRGKYSYPASDPSYKSRESKILITCPNHGNFAQEAGSHVCGSGCPACGGSVRTSYEAVVSRCLDIHQNEYAYAATHPGYVNIKSPISVVCKVHGEFMMSAFAHTQGQKCPKCSPFAAKSYEAAVAGFKVAHGDTYTYPDSCPGYRNNRSVVAIICKTHGRFSLEASKHQQGRGCQLCGLSRRSALRAHSHSDITTLASVGHKGRFSYPKDPEAPQYRNTKDKLLVCCPLHGEFRQEAANHVFAGQGCPKCWRGRDTQWHKDICQILIDAGQVVERDQRKLEGKLEIDIWLPELSIGIELNGLYFHSSRVKKNDCHRRKLDIANSQGIFLLQIFEDEWRLQRSQVINLILSKLPGTAKSRVGARATEVVTLKPSVAKEFCTRNHIQGACGATVHLGLMFENDLVACMSFQKGSGGRGKITEGTWNLARYATSRLVVGGASKLLKAFTLQFDPKQVVSFSDNRYSKGDMYRQLGFSLVKVSDPDYTYVVNNRRIHKSNYQRKHLSKKLKVFNPEMSEKQNCEANRIYQIYDCGLTKWELNL